jgi:NAD(P)-dependent dehydrogenase (short-subunit alcohol dehydrogenase family)
MAPQKSALITGGNSGIGYATAALLKEHGYAVTISGRSEAALGTAAAQLDVSHVVADMADLEDLDRLAAAFSDGLDLLVNNAGTAQFVPLEAHTAAMIDHCFHTNVRGPMYLIQRLLGSLAQRKGNIVNVSSIIVENGKPHASLYAASKGAIDAMVRSLALELAPRGIRINAVSPGAIETPMMDKLGIPEELKPVLVEQQINAIPLKRFGQPGEVAEVILALAQSGYVTGAVWKVDGGVNAS